MPCHWNGLETLAVPAISYFCAPTRFLGSRSTQIDYACVAHACVANRKHLPNGFVCSLIIWPKPLAVDHAASKVIAAPAMSVAFN